MKILVTGSAGFIGYHLVKHLVQEGEYEVVGIDNINDYYDVRLKYARLEDTGIAQSEIREAVPLTSCIYPNYRFVKLDLTDKDRLSDLFRTFKADVVVNLAAQAGVRYSIENPEAYIQSNIVGFFNLLECCRHYPVTHLVYASSSSVYGNSVKVPYSEDDRTDFPVSLYAATKKSNELLSHSYSHLYHIPTTGLRFFTVYGPYGRPDMAPMLFTDAIYRGKRIKVFNHGDLSRDFTYIADIVTGIVKTILNPPRKGDLYRIYNIGGANPTPLMDFIRTLEETIGRTALLDMFPMQQGDVYHTCADVTKLAAETAYKPETGLKEGIAGFIKWYKSYFPEESANA
ncbi:MAG: NAD-dependent epimerase/dehydratase family protein [Tannerellaceae bacterium]|nr:NAD-dependent epimerase/dehydratase family protein [Tannerellaceae bacterium]